MTDLLTVARDRNRGRERGEGGERERERGARGEGWRGVSLEADAQIDAPV